MRFLLRPGLMFLGFLMFWSAAPRLGAESLTKDDPRLAPVRDWIAAQRDTDSMAGEFTQVRTLKALRKPLSTTGRFWFEAPDQFRWELGDPARTVAVHSGDRLTVLDVAKKKAEVTSTSSEEETGSDMSDYFTMSFPRTWEAFEANFEIVSLVRVGGNHLLELKPTQRRMARGIRTMTFEIAEDHATRGFVLKLKDGSEMETTFDRVDRNVEVDDARFAVSLAGYEVTERDGG